MYRRKEEKTTWFLWKINLFYDTLTSFSNFHFAFQVDHRL